MKQCWLRIFVFALGLGGTTFLAAESWDASYHLILARLFAEEGSMGEAAEAYMKAIEVAPEDAYLRLEYGRFLLRERKIRKAVQQISEARRLAPQETEILRAFAETQMKLINEIPEAMNEAKSALEELRRLDPEDLESMVTLGQIYLSEGRPADAATVFEEVLSRSSGNRVVYRLLVDAYLRAGQVGEAEELLRQALMLDPTFTRARISLAEILAQQGRNEDAIQILEEAAPGAPGLLDVQKRLALELHRAGRYEDALSVLQTVLDSEPGYSAGIYLKALILSLQGRNEEAIVLARRLSALDPENVDVAILLSRALEAYGEAEEAATVLQSIEGRLRASGAEEAADRAFMQGIVILARSSSWERIVELIGARLDELGEDSDLDLLLIYAEGLSQLGREDQALEFLEGMKAKTREGRSALAKQAEILFRKERDSEARSRLSELTESGEIEDLLRAAEVYQGLERYDEAVPILERAIEVDPGSVQALFWLGASYERMGRDAEAAEALEGVIELDPQFAPALNYLGYMWAEQGRNLQEALGLVQRAVALEPDNGAYIDSLGWAHFQLGQYEEARGHLERAASLVGDDATVQEHLGDLYQALGDLERAREHYRRALELEPEDAAAVEKKLKRLNSRE